jgi:pimeloyl-ACP methyl ester carboxylesterase
MHAKLCNVLVGVTAVLGAACGERQPVAPESAAALSADRQNLNGPQEIQGEIGPGALYSVSIPANWNGDLVVFAHGWMFPSDPVALPDIGPFRDGVHARGYGLALSSYSENGFAVRDGVLRTRQVRDLFISNFGQPRRTYLSSGSMGAQVIMRLAQENPQHYDGVLPMCGPVGGSRMEIDYIMNVRVLFDYLYPGVIPGDAVHVPAGLDFGTDVVPAVIEAILANPAPAFELAGVDQVDIRYADFGELIESILTGLFFNTLDEFMGDLRERTHGHDYFDNTRVAYTGSANDAALNAGVDRFAAAPDALEFLRHWYQPDGGLTMPVLTVHTTRDPVVPRLHDAAFQAAVAAAGKSDLLVQRFIDVFGHCSEDWADDLAAFDDLRTWVETGIRPTP